MFLGSVDSTDTLTKSKEITDTHDSNNRADTNDQSTSISLSISPSFPFNSNFPFMCTDVDSTTSEGLPTKHTTKKQKIGSSISVSTSN